MNINTQHKNISSLLLMTLATTSAIAEDDKFDTLIVLAERDKPSEANLTDADISILEAATLEDLFQRTPSVLVNGGRANAQQIFVNGLESVLSNVTIDGATQGHLYHHSANIFLEPELLQQVGINAGAGSALDGLSALNGSIRFETKSAYDFLGDKDLYGLSKGIYYNNGDGFKLSQTLALKLTDQWAVLLSGGYTDVGDYDDGDGNDVDLSAYDSRNLLLKFSGDFGDSSIDIGFEHVFSETVSYDRPNVTADWLIDSGRPTGVLQELQQTRNTGHVKFTHNPDNDFIDFYARASFSEQTLERMDTGDTFEQQSFDFNVKNKSILSDSFAVTYGLDFRALESDNYFHDFPAGNGSEEEIAAGIFFQADWDPSEYVNLSFGGRLDHYDFTDFGGQEFDSTHFSPNATVTVTPLEGLQASLGYAQAYRGVGIREVYFSQPLPTNLDGEEAENIEATIQYERNGYFAKARYFDQTIDNYIYPFRGTGSQGDIVNEGYEITVGYKQEDYYVTLGLTDNEPDVAGNNPDIFNDDFGLVVAGRFWALSAGYHFRDIGLELGANIQYRESVEEEAHAVYTSFPNVAGKESYALVNVFARWDVPQVDGLSLQLNIDNLFDEDYQDHTIFTASGYQSPGRQIRVGATYKF